MAGGGAAMYKAVEGAEGSATPPGSDLASLSPSLGVAFWGVHAVR